MKRILVTGGAGFIGSALIRQLITETDVQVVNLDKLTYAASVTSLESVSRDPRYRLETIDVCDAINVARVLREFRPDAVVHLAAESHVDRSIDGPATFVQTNIVGTYVLLEQCVRYLRESPTPEFRFHHVSTDEVFGSLGVDGAFTEETPYDPRSPYSATKAASDHLVRAWSHTFGLPILLTNCSNNYGPYQFPEKLIPLMILKGLAGEPLPVYGQGENVRDWLHVNDHARAIRTVLERGQLGRSYNIGGSAERTNLAVVHSITDLLDELAPSSSQRPHRRLISFVKDRPGHDLRYAMDCGRIRKELDWRPRETFETGLRNTVMWYLENQAWWEPLTKGRYSGERLGLAASTADKKGAA